MRIDVRELLEPMLAAKRVAIYALRSLCEARVFRSPPWWAWTVWLAYAITVRRIEDA